MTMKKDDKKNQPKKRFGKVSSKVKSYAKDPFFVKKAEEAKAFMLKAGLPKELVAKHN